MLLIKLTPTIDSYNRLLQLTIAVFIVTGILLSVTYLSSSSEALFSRVMRYLSEVWHRFTNRPRKISRFWRWGLSILLGLGLILALAGRSHAAETVILQYYDQKLSLPRSELQDFVKDNQLSPELATFLQKTQENPDDIRHWLTTEITPRLSLVLPEQFLLLQVNKIIGDPLGWEDLASLKMALGNALDGDRSFSVMEVLEEYPKSDVRLTLNLLQRVYTDVDLFVTRIAPVMTVAQNLLPELVCDCNIATTSDLELNSLPTANLVAQTVAAQTVAAQTVAAQTGQSTDQSTGQSMGIPSKTNSPATLTAYRQAHAAIQSAFAIATSANDTQDSTLIAASATDSAAYANKRLILAFGPFRPSITIGELTRFVETGELSRGWRFYFRVAGVDRDGLRKVLAQPVKVDGRTLDRQLNSLLGEFVLYEVGQLIQTPSGTANIQALRSAMILSALPDNQLSMVEVLQHYPLQEVKLNGLRLARLGGAVSQFRSRGGLDGALTDMEGWLLQIQASAAEDLCDCDQPVEQNDPLVTAPIPAITPETVAQFLPANWQPVPSHREDRGNVKVVWLQGTPYEMGYQHGKLLHDEIASIGPKAISAARLIGKGLALGRLARNRTYPALLEECRGLSDATQDLGITMEVCEVMAYADVFQEILGYTLPQELFWDGCNQFVATGNATIDGRLYHGSSVDNGKPVPYVINNSVIFVRQPTNGLPHVFVTYPGVIWPNSGMNVAGITMGLDTAHPHDASELSLRGRSNVQIMAKMLLAATSFDEAREIMETQPRVRANLIMITDGKSKQAGVFEFTGRSLAVRKLQENGLLYVTNHFVLPEMQDKQPLPIDPSSTTRFARFQQLMEPNQPDSFYGRIEPTVMAKIGRDRTNPDTKQFSPFEVFDDNASPGGNGSLRQAIYDPDRLKLWVAAGPPPVPENPFVCFSVGELLNFPNAASCETPSM